MSIADKIQRLNTSKNNIASAITAKGGIVGIGDGFEDFPSDIATIPSGSQVDIESNKSVTITQNGTTIVTPSTGKDAMAKVTATINVPQPSGNINLTAPGVHDVENYTTATINEPNLLAENIRNGITILGQQGSLSPSFNIGTAISSSQTGGTSIPFSNLEDKPKMFMLYLESSSVAANKACILSVFGYYGNMYSAYGQWKTSDGIWHASNEPNSSFTASWNDSVFRISKYLYDVKFEGTYKLIYAY